MAIDTPARLAVLGAGPIGLEAALYGRFLGYGVILYERGEVAQRVLDDASAPMTAPFREARTTLGLAALHAQDESYQPPDDETKLTCGQWRDRYLIPLSATDLLSDHIRLHTTVVAIDQDDAAEMFRVCARAPGGTESVESFDGVLDCTGRDPNPVWDIPEPLSAYFHILGSKAAGSENFALTTGYGQIRAAFAILGDRESLDLYASASRLLPKK